MNEQASAAANCSPPSCSVLRPRLLSRLSQALIRPVTSRQARCGSVVLRMDYVTPAKTLPLAGRQRGQDPGAEQAKSLQSSETRHYHESS